MSKPIRGSTSAATWVMADGARMSVGPIRRILAPSYPEAFSIARARSRPFAPPSSSIPASVAIGVPGVNIPHRSL